jgi:hypothetical protein
MTARPSDEELTKFGIGLDDEGPHRFDPAVEWWNESWFFDWFDAEGRVAGHCRFGVHPNQRRAWIWYYHLADGEWIVVEEPRLPLDAVRLAPAPGAGPDTGSTSGPCWSYDGWGLSFAWEPEAPLRSGRFRFSGFGRVVSGPRAGLVLPVGADLHVEATGAAHSMGRARAPGHESEGYPASRFEQPIDVRGTLRAGADERPYRGRGERDHSWGPRHWNLEWTFLVLSSDDLRLQCAEARIPGLAPIHGGYLARATTGSITEARFDLSFRDEDLRRPVEGRFAATGEDGSRVEAAIEPLAAAEIDITHTFVPPQRSVYRRALVRGRRTDGPPLLGWIEFNRFVPKP